MHKNIFPKTPLQPQVSQQQQLLQMLKQNPELLKKYQQQLTRLQSSSKFKNLQQPITNKQYLQKLKSNQIQKILDSEGGLIIKPEEGFVLKFLDKRTGEKIFVNVVKHEAVDHPEEKQLVDFDNQVGLRIPMSMGLVREDRDKNGNACKVVDVVMNPKIIITAEANFDILQFMAQIISNYLLEKYKITVSEEMLKKVKGLKYKGTSVQIQRVKARKSPKIQQLSEQEQLLQKQKQSQQQKLFNQISGQFDHQKKISRPQFKIFILTNENQLDQYFFDSFNKQTTIKIIIEIDLSLLIHSRGIHLQGSRQMVYLMVKGFYQLGLRMPVEVKEYKAKFGRKERRLRIEGLVVKNKKNQNSNENDIEVKDKQISFSEEESKKRENNQKKQIKVEFQNQLLDQLV